ncbi:unannotated protein [freshwater metagenome]
MVLKLDRSPGQKDQRWVQLLTGAPSAQTISQAGSSDSQPSRLQAHNAALEERISAVELELERMRKLLEDLIGPIGD